MNKIGNVIRTAILGGLTVVLPTILLVWILQWLAGLVGEELDPIAALISHYSGLPPWLALILAALVILGVCFFIGLSVRTKSGAFVVRVLEDQVLMRVPGYRTLKEVVRQFGDRQERVFSEAVLVVLGDARAMGFVTDRDAAGVTVFIPTSPNPTTGIVLHLPSNQVIPVALRGNEMFTAIIGCGVNSRRLFPGAIAPNA